MARRHIYIYTFIWFLAITVVRGQPKDDTETVYDLGPGVTPPRVVKKVNPEYSGSDGVRVVGSVLVGLVVSSRGLPKDLRIVKSLEKEVDEITIEAVKHWRFDPAMKDGKAVAVNVTLEIEFKSR
jgi:protein TonB